MQMLEDLSELTETSFGQPDPRHGLRLLWWFANNCVDEHWINGGEMIAKYNPQTRKFGFKPFQNRLEGHERNHGRLLPECTLPYYEVGNLEFKKFLPSYIYRKSNSGNKHEKNKDRIIVSYDKKQKTFESVYVTEHLSKKWERKLFDQDRTYHISPDLIQRIQELDLDQFLQETKNNPESDSSSQSEFSNEDKTPLISPGSADSESNNTEQNTTNRPAYTSREESCCCCIS